MAVQKILFPLDFSERSVKALEEALFFTSLNGLSLLCYHVYHRPAKGERGAKTLIGRQREIREKYEALCEQFPALKEDRHEFRMELGISTDKLIEMANSGEVDLIIMATKGAKGIGQLWGSKTASIVRQVDLPILVIPDNTTLRNIKTLAWAYDYRLSPEDDTLRPLVRTAELLKADVDVLSIHSSPDMLSDDRTTEAQQELMEHLEGIPHTFNFSYHRDIQTGIMEYAHANDIGLIFIISKTYNYIEQAFHESLTKKMVFQSDIPLLIKKFKG